MAETILLIGKILGILYVICKFINVSADISGHDEVIDVMGTSLSLRSGGLSSRRTL